MDCNPGSEIYEGLCFDFKTSYFTAKLYFHPQLILKKVFYIHPWSIPGSCTFFCESGPFLGLWTLTRVLPYTYREIPCVTWPPDLHCNEAGAVLFAGGMATEGGSIFLFFPFFWSRFLSFFILFLAVHLVLLAHFWLKLSCIRKLGNGRENDKWGQTSLRMKWQGLRQFCRWSIQMTSLQKKLQGLQMKLKVVQMKQ